MRGNLYHGIVVGESLGKETLDRMRIIGRKRGRDFGLLKVEIGDGSFAGTISRIQKSLKPGYYAHFYRGNELIIVFRKKIFRIKPDKKTWKGAIAYGRSLGIPEKQLDFFPCSFQEETW